jgi:hypothetical protein
MYDSSNEETVHIHTVVNLPGCTVLYSACMPRIYCTRGVTVRTYLEENAIKPFHHPWLFLPKSQ